MTFWKWFGKTLLCVVLDVADFFIGRIPIAGSIWDAVLGAIGVYLWGPTGAIQFLELIDITDQWDGFIPSLTISAIFSIGQIWSDD